MPSRLEEIEVAIPYNRVYSQLELFKNRNSGGGYSIIEGGGVPTG